MPKNQMFSTCTLESTFVCRKGNVEFNNVSHS